MMIPTLEDIQEGSGLRVALEILFEHSPVLTSTLEPQLRTIHIQSYSHLIDSALSQISLWDSSAQSLFISGHPRIGEIKNLSVLSAKEQQSPTSPQVLARLAHLNAYYEAQYPGLRYITFVNGRSRQSIAEEMEDILHIPHSLSPHHPPLHTISPLDISTDQWKQELHRALFDIGRIAKSRLGTLGVN